LFEEVEFAVFGLDRAAKPDDIAEVGDIDVVFGIGAPAARCSSLRQASGYSVRPRVFNHCRNV
jgi:hypothetical protein